MQRLPVYLLLLIMALSVCAAEEQAAAPPAAPEPTATSTTPLAAGLQQKDPLTLVGPKNFLDGYTAIVAERTVHAVVEVPSGYVDKWEVKNEDGLLHWDMKNDKPRRVKYLGYPCNYGMVPRTVLAKERGGDGDPLDVLVLGEAVPRGTVLEARVIGLFRMRDGGELDVKLVAVRAGTAFADIQNVSELKEKFPGVAEIIETWFGHYKGPGVVQTEGFGDVDEALGILKNAAADFAKAHGGS